MIADQTRTTKPVLAASPFRVFATAWAAYWYLLKLHMAESHGLPRASAGEAPADWLRPPERHGARRRVTADAYGRWTLGPPTDAQRR